MMADSTDLYSRVKLRASNRKVHYVAMDAYAAEDSKSATDRSRKYRGGIRQGVFSENVAAQLETLSRKNAISVENSRLRTSTEVTFKETNPNYARRRENKQTYHQFANVQNFDMSDLLSDEGTAIEMLDALRKEIPENSSNNRLDIGDLIWGRVKSYPWWPGQIFDEALASPSVQSNKREGGILVAFYGDYTYAWLDPREIVPFDIYFDENLRQTNAQEFLTGVKEAIGEMKRRVALALVCHCQNNSNLQSITMEGNSIKQIQKAREDFHPQGMIYFLQCLALSPRKNVKQNPYWIKNIASIFAYRKAVVKEFDETYDQDFKEQHKTLECPAGITKENQKASRAQFSDILDAEAEVKTKRFKQLTEVYELPKKEELNDRHGCPSTKNFGMERPVRMNKLKYLAGFAAKQQVLEVQGESQTGIRSGSSTLPPKNSQMKQESIRRDVKERMLTITFPHQTILPSVSEVKAKFACFGPLDEYSTRFLWKSSTYQLVFLQKSDAEVAYRHAIQNSALFSTPEVRYCLQASDHDANESGNSQGLVENQEEIQLTSSLNSNEFASELMSPSFQPSLLPPEKNQLKFSLEKLSAESSDCPSIIESHSLVSNTDYTEIPENAVPLSSPSNFPLSSTITYTKNEQYGIDQFIEDINKKHSQVEAKKNSNSQNTTIANNIDISHQLINLLSSCGGILSELKSAYEHMF